MPEPSAAWTIADRIDFEQLLATPLPAGDDLRLYEDEIAPRLSPAAQERRGAVFRAWLEARRRRFDGPLAGRAYDVGYRVVRVAAIIPPASPRLEATIAVSASRWQSSDATPKCAAVVSPPAERCDRVHVTKRDRLSLGT